MKQFLSATTLLLLAATLASAAPLTTRQNSVTIGIKTGDGDSATTLSVNLDQVTPTAGQSTKAVAASVDTPGVFCQAFADTGATQPLGSVFTSTSGASFSASSSGDTASQASDAVNVGAYLCSASQSGVAPKTGSGTSTGTSTSTSTGSSSTSTSTSTSQTKPSTGKVTVELEQVSDQFVQTDIPLDNSLVSTTATAPQLGNMGIDLSLVSLTGSTATLAQAACQLFEDAAGTVPVGNLATSSNEALLTANRNAPSHIQSIRCGVAA